MAKKSYISNNSDEHALRGFYVSNKLEFSFFCREGETKESILEDFLQDKDWIGYENLYEVKYLSHTLSRDTMKVKIKTRPMNKKEVKKARK